ncbi:MAG: hypothetical protein HQ553_16240 [Chloroflexi bacterium]|nr:hypothetical protein [Chloroflexota bacterium]
MTTETKHLQQDVVANVRHWQRVENAAIASTGQIIEKTENPLIRLVAEIIQRDSLMHHRVQEFIADSLDQKAVSLSPDELVEVWSLIEHHIKIEQQTIELAQQALNSTKGQQGMIVQNYLINYLMQDEQKHNDLLSRLDDIKKGIYRSV